MNISPIKFHFHPFDIENKHHVIEKSEGDIKKRYLCGVSSGLSVDHHGERMTEKCIKSFLDQANSGDILLYADKHDVNFTDDIGLLSKAKIMDNGDWYTEYRLYDESDEIDQASQERGQKLWKQINGLHPYRKAREKGFSVEGNIPESGIVEMGTDGRRVIDEVMLDGVVVVPRPAYKDSIAHAVYKALGIDAPWVLQKNLGGKLKEKMLEEEIRNTFYKKRYQLNDSLEDLVREIMTNTEVGEQRIQLETALEEYKNLMIDLILNNQDFFIEQTPALVAKDEASPYSIDQDSSKKQILDLLSVELEKLGKYVKEKLI